LATLIIVAVVIIMAALTEKVKASPVFDRANLKEECNIFPGEARWNRYSKARRRGSEWAASRRRRLTRPIFPERRER
jgi:hypothetical protein